MAKKLKCNDLANIFLYLRNRIKASNSSYSFPELNKYVVDNVSLYTAYWYMQNSDCGEIFMIDSIVDMKVIQEYMNHQEYMKTLNAIKEYHPSRTHSDPIDKIEICNAEYLKFRYDDKLLNKQRQRIDNLVFSSNNQKVHLEDFEGVRWLRNICIKEVDPFKLIYTVTVLPSDVECPIDGKYEFMDPILCYLDYFDDEVILLKGMIYQGLKQIIQEVQVFLNSKSIERIITIDVPKGQTITYLPTISYMRGKRFA
jgi:hypothetical protein